MMINFATILINLGSTFKKILERLKKYNYILKLFYFPFFEQFQVISLQWWLVSPSASILPIVILA